MVSKGWARLMGDILSAKSIIILLWLVAGKVKGRGLRRDSGEHYHSAYELS